TRGVHRALWGHAGALDGRVQRPVRQAPPRRLYGADGRGAGARSAGNRRSRPGNRERRGRTGRGRGRHRPTARRRAREHLPVPPERTGARTLLDLVALGVEAPSAQAIASARIVREEPVLVQRFVNALLEGTAVAKRDRERALCVLSERLDGADDAALNETYE